uniref:hypothetical protein n=1 Tax=Crenothrix polyspora TaxID=360316 RepID=UPI000B35FD0D
MKNKKIIATSLVSLALLAGCGAEDQGAPPANDRHAVPKESKASAIVESVKATTESAVGAAQEATSKAVDGAANAGAAVVDTAKTAGAVATDAAGKVAEGAAAAGTA